MKGLSYTLARQIALITGPMLIMALLFCLAILLNYVIHLPYFNITGVAIQPKQGDKLSYVSPATIHATLSGRINGNFFTLDLPEVQQLLQTSPWVRKADITRLWPNSLLIKIEEHEPFALWNDNAMINTWGEVFVANRGQYEAEDQLPQFYGPEGSEHLVVQRYAELVRWLAPLKLSIKSLSLNERYAWSIELSNDTRLILGRDPGAETANPYDSMGAGTFASTIERFVRSWPALLKRVQGKHIKQVDLRYTKGFAITLATSDSEKK
ncbi:cell division protein FtsQ/DivIB [Brackiella oedipodis]|uniref:cell division protein FtsQ/DivIB n=1 Tax=Brackiella oedipodis TaxID=124225 RepID=UPI001FE0710A|nr:cell division protein FtsQ/DivIB [Brackiella oedipodis]